MTVPCLSTRALGDNDYVDGQIYDLFAVTRSVLKDAILGEQWINMSWETRQQWISLMFSPTVRFVGTVVSRSRQQVEVSVMFRTWHPVHGAMVSFVLTLGDFHRFHHL